MTARDRTVVLVLVLGAVLAGFWFAVLGPRRDEAASLADEVTAAEERRDAAAAAVAAAEKVKAGYDRDYATVAKLGKAVPTDDDVPSLLYQLSRAAGGTKVDFRELTLAAGGQAAAPAATQAAQAAALAQAQNQKAGAAQGAGGTATTPTATTPAAGASAPGTPAATDPAAATQAAAAALPPGAVVGAAGFPTMPFDFVFRGSYFRVQSFLERVQDLTKLDGRRIDVDGRLLTIDGFSLKGGVAHFHATSYLLPADQGLTAGATPAGPVAAAQTTPTPTSPGAAAPVATAAAGG